jgi:hypothetical protein
MFGQCVTLYQRLRELIVLATRVPVLPPYPLEPSFALCSLVVGIEAALGQ